MPKGAKTPSLCCESGQLAKTNGVSLGKRGCLLSSLSFTLRKLFVRRHLWRERDKKDDARDSLLAKAPPAPYYTDVDRWLLQLVSPFR